MNWGSRPQFVPCWSLTITLWSLCSIQDLERMVLVLMCQTVCWLTV